MRFTRNCDLNVCHAIITAVLKEFWVETALAPITPGKQANPNRGQIAMVSNEVGSSSHPHCGFTGKASQAEGWGPFYKLQDRVFASRSSSIAEEIDSLPQWGAMKFTDLLALNNGLMGRNQASNGGILNSLHQEFHGFNQRVEIQQNAEKSRPVITMNLFPQEHIPVLGPTTPGCYKSFQGNDALPGKASQDTPNRPTEEFSEVSDTDDLYKEEEEPDGLDLNKTSQQKPRRKKHRPKVVSEARPKQRAHKPADANKTPRQQRKFVSKSKTNIPSATPPPEREEIALDCKIPDRRPFRSCRKTLKFDLEDQMEAAWEYSTYDILHEFNTALENGESKKTKNLTAISSKHEIRLKRANSGSADSQADYLYLRSEIFSCVHKKRRTEKVVKTNMAHILSFTNALESIRAAASLKKCSREDHGIYFPENCKRRRTEKVLKVNIPHILSFTRALENIREAKGLRNTGKQAVSHHDNRQAIKWGDINELNKRFISPICVHSQDGFRTYKRPSRSSDKGRVKVKGTQKKSMITLEASSMKSHQRKQNRKKSRKMKSVEMGNNRSLTLYDERHFTENPKGRFLALPWISTNNTNADAIIEGMKQLSINREGSIVQYQQTNALIPYRVHRRQTNDLALYRRNNAVIPFEGEQSSKRQERAKVDIDDETNRVWNLLLEDINSQGIDGTDEDKTKWWEDERNVFRGRVDSFIARMRLVQGDRRFSPWKGSVVDSVVGVFLTQNVSDHLSSSAYMALAARYPPRSANKVRRDSEDEDGPFVEEPENYTVDLDDRNHSLALNEKTVEEHCDENSRNLHGDDVSEEKKSISGSIKESETPSTSVNDKAIDEVVSSKHSVISQNSAESPGVPISRSSAENGLISYNSSEGEAPINNSNPYSSQCSASFVELLKMAENPMLHSTYSPADKVMSNCSTIYQLQEHHLHSVEEESRLSDSTRFVENVSTEASNITTESVTDFLLHKKASKSNMGMSSLDDQVSAFYVLEGEEMVFQSLKQPTREHGDTTHSPTEESVSPQMNKNLQVVSGDNVATESTCASNCVDDKLPSNLSLPDHNYSSGEAHNNLKQNNEKQRKGKNPKKPSFDWDSLRKQAQANGSGAGQRTANTMDSLDWEAIRSADVNDIAYTIRERGMNNRLAERIKEFLDRIVNDHGSIDLEWLRDVPPDKAKEYLLSIKGLGLKSVECVRLLTLHHLAFPVDTNVGRIAVRLGWVPLQPLPESLQLHLLELYPILESIQKYLWPRLCKLDQRTLYELHYHMITFGKVFCTKRQPNCNACPLRGECRHFASAFASARLALPGPEDKSIMLSEQSNLKHQHPQVTINALPTPLPMASLTLESKSDMRNCEPIVEIPASPEQEPEEMQTLECDIEDAFSEDPNEIPTIKLNMEQFTQTLQAYVNSNKELQEGDMSKALVALAAGAASIPIPKLKNVSRLRTEHHVYELPDTHYLLNGLDKREPDDPCPYLLAIWSPGETANSTEPPERRCNFEEPGQLCSEETCFYCNGQREANSRIARGTLLIPCRTAMRGSFPLNGTYFQVNEVFADQDSSLYPIQVPRESLWNLPRRTVYFGTSIPTIFKGLSTEDIQHCFWRGYVCVRGFDQTTRAPRPLMARLHYSAHKYKGKGKTSGKA